MTKIGTLQTPAKRLSASGAAGTALGGLASVGANAGVSALLNKVESLFRRDEFEGMHDFESRSPLSAGSVGGQVLGGLAGGAASGAVGNLLGEVEKLFRRSEGLEINDLD
ncbi:hypothetical protein DL93DRAFT_2087048 [Clavulina sp. PMI_390]|nr:hypothetical protein DL93DRAFT_2087048 [Clavulina sp. PMI_390]